MPKTKYYAVKVGKETGIFDKWDQCSKQVIGYTGAQYKSFKTKEEAENYLNDSYLNDVQEKKERYIPNQDLDYIFCDGSEIKGTDKAGYGVYYPRYNLRESRHLHGGTNNQCEVKAMILAFYYLSEAWSQSLSEYRKRKFIMVTDSTYVIKSLTEWVSDWKKNNWKKSNGKIIENLELIQELNNDYQYLLTKGIEIEFLHRLAHQSKPSDIESLDYYLWDGNRIADLLAKNG